MPAVMKAMFEPGQLLGDFAHRFFGRGAADIGTRTGAEALGDRVSELDAAFAQALLQGLRIGVGHHELDAFQLRADHVGDGIAAGAAHADHRDLRADIEWILGQERLSVICGASFLSSLIPYA